MEIVKAAVQLIIALGILNVWLVRRNQATAWRGGDARNMQEEFRKYGLSERLYVLIGVAKVSLAALLVVGLWVPMVAALAAARPESAPAILPVRAAGPPGRVASNHRSAVEPARRRRIGRGSSPSSTPPRNPGRTSPVRPRFRIPRPGPEAVHSSRRRDPRACRST